MTPGISDATVSLSAGAGGGAAGGAWASACPISNAYTKAHNAATNASATLGLIAASLIDAHDATPFPLH